MKMFGKKLKPAKFKLLVQLAEANGIGTRAICDKYLPPCLDTLKHKSLVEYRNGIVVVTSRGWQFIRFAQIGPLDKFVLVGMMSCANMSWWKDRLLALSLDGKLTTEELSMEYKKKKGKLDQQPIFLEVTKDLDRKNTLYLKGHMSRHNLKLLVDLAEGVHEYVHQIKRKKNKSNTIKKQLKFLSTSLYIKNLGGGTLLYDITNLGWRFIYLAQQLPLSLWIDEKRSGRIPPALRKRLLAISLDGKLVIPAISTVSTTPIIRKIEKRKLQIDAQDTMTMDGLKKQKIIYAYNKVPPPKDGDHSFRIKTEAGIEDRFAPRAKRVEKFSDF